MKVTMTIAGAKELDAALAEFSKATARNILQRTLLKAADPILETAQALAPVRTGVLKSKIRKDTRKPKGHASKAAFAEAMAAGASKAEAAAYQRAVNAQNGQTFAEVFVGVEERVAQAWPQEIGTVNHAPHPYIRPAIEQRAEDAQRIIETELSGEIERARQRAARKALKTLKG
jgi:HK97 gp10 family phage protein